MGVEGGGAVCRDAWSRSIQTLWGHSGCKRWPEVVVIPAVGGGHPSPLYLVYGLTVLVIWSTNTGRRRPIAPSRRAVLSPIGGRGPWSIGGEDGETV